MILVLLSALIYGVEPSLRALALQEGATATDVMLLTTVVFFAVAAFVCLVCRQSLRIPRRALLQLLIAGAVGVSLTGVLLTLSYRSLPVGCATVIHFMYPSIVCVAMAIFFKKGLTPGRIVAIILSIVGMVCISGDSLGGSISGLLLAFSSGLTFAVYIILLDKGGTAQIPQRARLFFIACGALVSSIATHLLLRDSGTWTVLGFASVSACGGLSFLACLCFTAGVKRVGAAVASFCSLLEPITSLAVSAILFHYVLTAKSILGCVISMLAILLICLENRRETRRSDDARKRKTV